MNEKEKLERIAAPGFDQTANWRDLPIAIIDFETTGLNPAKDRIVEFGIALFYNRQYCGGCGGLLNPECKLSEEVSRIHGITDADLVGKLTFREVLNLIRATLADQVPAAYNADFDRGFLHNELARVVQSNTKECSILSDRAAFDSRVEWIDPLVWIRKIYKYTKGKKTLSNVCEMLKIKTEKAHRASDDAKAAGEVLFAIADKIEEASYVDLIQHQKKLAVQQERDFQAWMQKQDKLSKERNSP